MRRSELWLQNFTVLVATGPGRFVQLKKAKWQGKIVQHFAPQSGKSWSVKSFRWAGGVGITKNHKIVVMNTLRKNALVGIVKANLVMQGLSFLFGGAIPPVPYVATSADADLYGDYFF